MALCQCGCGESVKRSRKFVNKEHQLTWMSNGGARELQAMLPYEVLVKNGKAAGQRALDSGHLYEAAQKGGAKSREIAAQMRDKPPTTHE